MPVRQRAGAKLQTQGSRSHHKSSQIIPLWFSQRHIDISTVIAPLRYFRAHLSFFFIKKISNYLDAWQNENWPYAAHRAEVQVTDIHFLVSCNNFGMPPSNTSSAAFLTTLRFKHFVENSFGKLYKIRCRCCEKK